MDADAVQLVGALRGTHPDHAVERVHPVGVGVVDHPDPLPVVLPDPAGLGGGQPLGDLVRGEVVPDVPDPEQADQGRVVVVQGDAPGGGPLDTQDGGVTSDLGHHGVVVELLHGDLRVPRQEGPVAEDRDDLVAVDSGVAQDLEPQVLLQDADDLTLERGEVGVGEGEGPEGGKDGDLVALDLDDGTQVDDGHFSVPPGTVVVGT